MHLLRKPRSSHFLLMVLTSIPVYLWIFREGDTPTFPRMTNNASTSIKGDLACDFPRLDPWDPEIRDVVPDHPPSPVSCRKGDLVFELDFLNSEIVRVYEGNSLLGWRTCCYRTIHRGTNVSDVNNDDVERLSEQCFPILGSRMRLPPEHEFLAVFCDSPQVKAKLIQVLAQTPLKSPEVEATPSEGSTDEEEKKVNLVILGWDSVSHMEMHRSLPRVREFLVTNLSALWLEGYTKLGVNSYPNIIPFTTGLTSEEAGAAEGGSGKAKVFDDYPIFWNEFAKRGYRTSFAEDATGFGLFSYKMHGFLRQPVDYYFRPVARVADAHIMNGPSWAVACWGPVQSLRILLDYIKSLAHTLRGKGPYVQLVWVGSLTHSVLSAGTQGEDMLLDTFHWMAKAGHMNTTVLIFMSDHGLRFGDFLETRQGKIEGNMPFLYAVFPKWFRRKYPKALANFRENRERLTTHYDGHETLLDIGNLSKITDDAILKRSKDLEEAATLPRGISLFLPIPKRRTCGMAGVPDPFCICAKRQGIPKDHPDALEGATVAVSHLNNIVPPDLCAHITLKSVTSASTVLLGAEDPNKQLYEVSFVTSPGNASFDATVVKKTSRHWLWSTPRKPSWSVSGDISRTNRYGNQSFCLDVDQREMKPFCYCAKREP